MLYSTYYIDHCLKNNDVPDGKFIDWINKIESEVINKIHVNLLDLPDQMYMEFFENSKSIEYVSNIVVSDYINCINASIC